MRRSFPIVGLERAAAYRALAAAIAVALFAGCSGAGRQSLSVSAQTQSQQKQPQPSVAEIRPPAADLLAGADQDSARVAGGLYVKQGADHVNEYALPNSSNKPPACKDILPKDYYETGIGVNAQHILYITRPYYRTIRTFRPNCGGAGPTLSDPNGFPADVAFDNTKNNTVYVADNSSGGIDVYDKGAILPTRVLTGSTCAASAGVAVDRFGKVFQSCRVNNTLIEYPGGLRTGSKVLGVTGLSDPRGLEFDLNNNLIVFNVTSGILVYAPPYKGAPKRRIGAQGGTLYGKLDAANRTLYVDDTVNGNRVVNVYAYPLGTYEYRITTGLKGDNGYGIAVDPPSPN